MALELSAPAEQNHVRKLRVLKQAAQVFRQPTVRNLHSNYHSLDKKLLNNRYIYHFSVPIPATPVPYFFKINHCFPKKTMHTSFINISSSNIFDSSGSVVKPKLFIPVLVPTLEKFRARFRTQTLISRFFKKKFFTLENLNFLMLDAALLPRSCHIIFDCFDFCYSTVCRIRYAFRFRVGSARAKFRSLRFRFHNTEYQTY